MRLIRYPFERIPTTTHLMTFQELPFKPTRSGLRQEMYLCTRDFPFNQMLEIRFPEILIFHLAPPTRYPPQTG